MMNQTRAIYPIVTLILQQSDMLNLPMRKAYFAAFILFRAYQRVLLQSSTLLQRMYIQTNRPEVRVLAALLPNTLTKHQ